VWIPIHAMIIRGLLHLYLHYGDSFTVECPTGSGRQLTLYQVAENLADRATGALLRDPDGRRPVFGGQPILQTDPNWRDLVLFHEYFHGDNGAGIGASHQTGWSGLAGIFPLLFRGSHFRGSSTGGVPAQRQAETGMPAQQPAPQSTGAAR